jgi:hypothetical protein
MMVSFSKIELEMCDLYTVIEGIEKVPLNIQAQLIRAIAKESGLKYRDNVLPLKKWNQKKEYREIFAKCEMYIDSLKRAASDLWNYHDVYYDSRVTDDMKELINAAKDAILGIADSYENILSSHNVKTMNFVTAPMILTE